MMLPSGNDAAFALAEFFGHHLKLAYYLKDSISLKRTKKALNDIDKVVEKVKKKIAI